MSKESWFTELSAIVKMKNTRRNTLYGWPQMLVYVSVRNELVQQVETHLRNTDKLMTIPRQEAVGKSGTESR